MALADAHCDERERLPEVVPDGIRKVGGRRTIYATYRSEVRTVAGQPLRTRTLPAALREARPGDVVQLLAGKYWPPMGGDEPSAPAGPIELKDLRGAPERAITIRGLGGATILCGSNAAVPLYPDLPDRRHFAFFRLIGCEWIEIEDIAVESCWPCFVYAEDSRYVAVRRIQAIDALYLVFARGPTCHHFLLEGNDWRQDPSGALWDELEWDGMHHGEYRYFNGALFGSASIAGSVIIRRNRIRDAYNGVRMVAGPGADASGRNLNVEIYENSVQRLRDNAFEPEGAATNWWLHHNRICNTHAWFSFDRVGGGFWYIFGNLGWFDDRPGQPHDANTGGKVFKFSSKGPHPTRLVWVVHNSWFLRTFLAKKGVTRHFRHLNNAVQFCAPADFPACVCRSDRSFVGQEFLDGKWDATVVFDHDLSNKPFPALLIDNGQESQGRFDPRFHFRDPTAGDLRPAAETPTSEGARLTLTAAMDWPSEHDWSSATTDGRQPRPGAFQGERLFEGPPFLFFEPEDPLDGYAERRVSFGSIVRIPRGLPSISRHRWRRWDQSS